MNVSKKRFVIEKLHNNTDWSIKIRLLALGLTVLTVVNVASPFFNASAVLSKDAILQAYESMRDDMDDASRAISAVSSTTAQSAAIGEASSELNSMPSAGIDWDYMQHLDLAIGLVAEKTGLLSSFRFNNSFIDTISVENNKRQYRSDTGEGSAQVMSILFPSAPGTLEVNSKLDLTPTQMAKLFGILYEMRKRGVSIEDIGKMKDLARMSKETPIKSVETELKKIKAAFIEKGGDERVTKIDKHLENVDLYLKIESFMNSLSGKTNKKAGKDLLCGLDVMINKQESSNDNITPEKPLPKYTAERVLLGFFVMKYETPEHVKEFYTELKQQIRLKDGQEGTITKEKALEYMGKLHILYRDKVHENENIPYNNHLVHNNKNKVINYITDKQVSFNKTTFSDCVETSVRHVVNLMTYDKGDKSFHLPGSKCDVSKSDLDSVIKAIQSNGSVKRMSLKERIHMYYMYQTVDKANADDTCTRTLWNYVVGNMATSDDLYKVHYKKDGNNELSSGLLDAVKTYYNIAYALLDGKGCETAKEAIDKIEGCDDEVLESAFKQALIKTLKLFSPGYEVDVYIRDLKAIKGIEDNASTKQWDDFAGNIFVLIKERNNVIKVFNIEHIFGHATVSADAIEVITVSQDEKSMFDNYDARLLYDFLLLSCVDYKLDDVRANEFDLAYMNRYIDTSFLLKKYKEIPNHICRIIEHYCILKIQDNIYRDDFKNAVFYFLKNSNIIKNSNMKVVSKSRTYTLYEYAIKLILSNEKAHNCKEKDFVYWYVFNVLKYSSEFRDDAVDENNKEQINILLNIDKMFKSGCVNKEDVETIKKMPIHEVLRFRLYETTLLDYVVENVRIDDLKDYMEYLFRKGDETDQLIINIISKGINLKKWDVVECVLNYFQLYNMLIMPMNDEDSILISLIKSGQVDLINKFRGKFDFNANIYYVRESVDEYNAYEYIDKVIKDPSIKSKLDPSKTVRESMLTSEKLDIVNLKKLTIDDLAKKSKAGKSIIDRCINELNISEFVELIECLMGKDFSNRALILRWFLESMLQTDTSDMKGKFEVLEKYLNKENVELFSSFVMRKASILRDLVQDEAGEACLKDLVARLNEYNCMFAQPQKSEPVPEMNMGDDPSIAAYYEGCNEEEIKKIKSIISPHESVIAKIKAEKSLVSIPEFKDVKEYFYCYGGESIVSAMLHNLSTEDLIKFFDSIPLASWESEGLFKINIECLMSSVFVDYKNILLVLNDSNVNTEINDYIISHITQNIVQEKFIIHDVLSLKYPSFKPFNSTILNAMSLSMKCKLKKRGIVIDFNIPQGYLGI